MKMKRIFIYETQARYYLIGANSERTEFRVLKIDRSDASELQLVEDSHVYNARQILDMQSMLKSTNSMYRRVCIGCGILGFVKFLQGYYLVVATKRVKVGAVPTSIYRIADTQMIYLPAQQQTSSEEQKLVKLFQNVDLRCNFYFSYDFDLSRTFQSNWLTGAMSSVSTDGVAASEVGSKRAGMTVSDKFIWNWRMTEALRERDDVSADWLFYIVHGYFGQAVINAGRSLYLVLIARRSRHYAGTRYLKRGANWQGYVANEVEVEQALIETSLGAVANWPPRAMSSYVQVRGSVPVLWSHDLHQKVMAPKPAIQLDLIDPYFAVTAVHFNQLLLRFGAPLVAFNLLKRARREALISDHYQEGIAYLNQFLPQNAQIRSVCVDLSRLKKRMRNVEDGSAIEQLERVCEALVAETDYFVVNGGAVHVRQHGVVRSNCVDCLDRTNIAQFVLGRVALGQQLHAMRVVDRPSGAELDESDLSRVLELMYEECGNTLALQYGGSQLAHTADAYRPARKYSKPKIVTQSRDLVQTVSRFYSNTFSDAVKQASLNVFGGLIHVSRGLDSSEWLTASASGSSTSEQQNTQSSSSKPQAMLLADETVEPDYYLHNDVPAGRCPNARYSYTQWFTPLAVKYLPFAVADTCAYSYVPTCANGYCIECTYADNQSNLPAKAFRAGRNSLLFDAVYKPYRFSILDKHIQRQLAEVVLFDAVCRNKLRLQRQQRTASSRFDQAAAMRSLLDSVFRLRTDFMELIHIDNIVVEDLLKRCSTPVSKQSSEAAPPRLRKHALTMATGHTQLQSKPIWSKNVELNGTRIDLHVSYVAIAECASSQQLTLLRQAALSNTDLNNVPFDQLSQFERSVQLATVSVANENRERLAAAKHRFALHASRAATRPRKANDNSAICAAYLNVDRLCAFEYTPTRTDAQLYARYVQQ